MIIAAMLEQAGYSVCQVAPGERKEDILKLLQVFFGEQLQPRDSRKGALEDKAEAEAL